MSPLKKLGNYELKLLTNVNFLPCVNLLGIYGDNRVHNIFDK